MAYENLSDFVNELHDSGELVRIVEEVDPVLEITEITDRVCRSPNGGPALYFERVRGSAMPVVTNLLGSEKRICRALGVDEFEQAAERLEASLNPRVAATWLDKLKQLPQSLPAATPAKIVRSGACQQVVKLGRDVDLLELPAPHCWPLDTHRTIAAGQVFTKFPGTDDRSLESIGLQVLDKNLCTLHWNVQQAGCQNFLEYRKLGLQMPVAISLGGDPLHPLIAASPLPPSMDAFLLGSLLRAKPLELVKCRAVEMEVPANAEIIIEGYIDPNQPWEVTGPFGVRTGHYHLSGQFPRLHVTAITHRSNPVFPAMIPGRPPTEESWLNKAIERVFLPLAKAVVPELVDWSFPQSAGSRNLCFASIRKTYPQQARKVLHALWSMPQTLFTKMIVIVDEDVSVQNEGSVWFHVGANCHPGRDTVLSEGPADSLDHASPVPGIGHKLGLDATRKFQEEGHPRAWPPELSMSQEVRDYVSARWTQYGLGPAPK